MLTTEELINSLLDHHCTLRALAPRQLPEPVIRRSIERIRRRQLELNIDDENMIAVSELVAEPLKIVSFETHQALGLCEIYILPFSVCTAYSYPIDNRNIIVIGSGMIDLMEATSYSAHVIGRLPEQCDYIYPIESLPDSNLHDLVNQFVFLLLFQFFHNGDPLPNIKALATPTMIKDARISFAGGMAFLLLHEYAHLDLGHHQNRQTSSLSIDHIVTENLSAPQQQEHEADQHAIAYIEADYREIGHFWANSTFDFFTRMELLSGQFNQSHPLALNRIYHLNSTLSDNQHYYNPAERQTIAARLAQSFDTAHQSDALNNTQFFDINRATTLAILDQINPYLIDVGGPDLSPLWLSEAPNWRQNLDTEGVPWETDAVENNHTEAKASG